MIVFFFKGGGCNKTQMFYIDVRYHPAVVVVPSIVTIRERIFLFYRVIPDYRGYYYLQYMYIVILCTE